MYTKNKSQNGQKNFVIDDYISKKHFCNLLINQNLSNNIYYKDNYIN